MARRARVAPARELERQHHVFERRQRRHQVERLEHEAHALGAQARAAVFVERRQVGAREGYASGSRRIEARPAAPAASICPRRRRPTMATDSAAAMSNETSFTMVSIPSGLVTFFVRFSALSTLIRFIRSLLLAGVSRRWCACRRPDAAHHRRARRQPERRVRHQDSARLGKPARAAARLRRVRIPGGQRQRERRNHAGRTRAPATRARDAQARDRRSSSSAATTGCAGCRSRPAARISRRSSSCRAPRRPAWCSSA